MFLVQSAAPPCCWDDFCEPSIGENEIKIGDDLPLKVFKVVQNKYSCVIKKKEMVRSHWFTSVETNVRIALLVVF